MNDYQLPNQINHDGSRETYYKWELTKVQVTAFQTNTSGNGRTQGLLLPAVQV